MRKVLGDHDPGEFVETIAAELLLEGGVEGDLEPHASLLIPASHHCFESIWPNVLNEVRRHVVRDLCDAPRMLENRRKLRFAHKSAAFLVAQIVEHPLKLGVELSVRHRPVSESDLVMN